MAYFNGRWPIKQNYLIIEQPLACNEASIHLLIDYWKLEVLLKIVPRLVATLSHA